MSICRRLVTISGSSIEISFKVERVRGGSGTQQPWAVMSINACYWQAAHPLPQNTGWRIQLPSNCIPYKQGKNIYLKMDVDEIIMKLMIN